MHTTGRLAFGAPSLHDASSFGIEPNEHLVECALAPIGHVFAVLTQLRVQFWSALQTTVMLASVQLPRCSASAGGDAGHRIVWNPQGRSLAVATLDRRVLFLEADITLTSEHVVVAIQDALQLPDVPSRVCVGFEVQLEFGLILNITAANQCLLVCTSGGFVVGLGWNRGRVLFTWSSNSLLQRACTTTTMTTTAAVDTHISSTHSSATTTTSSAALAAALSSSSSFVPVQATSSGSGGGGEYLGGGGGNNVVRPVVGGAVVFFTYDVAQRLACFVLADGSVGLVRVCLNSDSTNTSPPTTSENAAASSGNCSAGYLSSSDGGGRVHPGLAALSVALNTTHGVLAMSCSDGSLLRLIPFDIRTLNVLCSPSGAARNADILPPWCDDIKSLGGVRCMRWSNDDTTLCVGFRKRGVAVFHHTGACLMASFGRFEMTARRVMPSVARGCISAAWDQIGHRLMCIGHDSTQFSMIPFSTIASMQDPVDRGSGGTVAVFGTHAVSVLLTGGEGSGGGGSGAEEATSWEAVAYPTEYVHENYPIRFCSMSADGQHIACAGAYGAAVYSRKVRKWRLFSVKRQERQLSCVAEPCWFSDLIVMLPVRCHVMKIFELQWYPRFHLNESSVVQRLKCDRRPVLVHCAAVSPTRSAESIFLMVDTANVLRVFHVEVYADSIQGPRSVGMNLTPMSTINLFDIFETPLQVSVCPLPRASKRRRQTNAFSTAGVSGGGVTSSGGSAPTAAGTTSASSSSSSRAPPAQPWLVMLLRDHSLFVVDISDLCNGSTRSSFLSGDPRRPCPTSEEEGMMATQQRCPWVRLTQPHVERVYRVYMDTGHYHPIFPNCSMFLTHDSQGVTLRWLSGGDQQPLRLTPNASSVSLLRGTPTTTSMTDPSSMLSSSGSSKRLPKDMWVSRIADVDADAIPLGVLPLDGVVVLAAEGLDPQPFAQVSSRFRMTVKSVLFAHRVLYPVMFDASERGTSQGLDLFDDMVNDLQCSPASPTDVAIAVGPTSTSTDPSAVTANVSVAPVDDDGIALCTHLLQQLREHGSFVGVMDFLLYLILHFDVERDCIHDHVSLIGGGVGGDGSGSFSYPTGGGGGAVVRMTMMEGERKVVSSSPRSSVAAGATALDASPNNTASLLRDRRRIRLLHYTIQLLKKFREYHTVMVGLVRKVDMSKWRLIFDVIGAPVDFFDDCLVTGHLMEAAHVVRVVMMDSVTKHAVKDSGDKHVSSTSSNFDDAVDGGGPSSSSSTAGSSKIATVGLSSASGAKTTNSSNNNSTSVSGGDDVAMSPHSVRVLSPLEAALRCSLRLFPIVLQQLDMTLISELFRFQSMLLVEMTHGECLKLKDVTSSSSSSVAGSGKSDSPSFFTSGATGGKGSYYSLGLERLKGMWDSSSSSKAATTGGGGALHSDLYESNAASSASTSSSASELLAKWDAVRLEFVFLSPHAQDNAAAAAFVRRFPFVRCDLERVLIRELLLEARVISFMQLCHSLSISVGPLLLSAPWRLVGLQWCAIGATMSQAYDEGAGEGADGTTTGESLPFEDTARSNMYVRKLLLQRVLEEQWRLGIRPNRHVVVGGGGGGGDGSLGGWAGLVAMMDALKDVERHYHGSNVTMGCADALEWAIGQAYGLRAPE